MRRCACTLAVILFFPAFFASCANILERIPLQEEGAQQNEGAIPSENDSVLPSGKATLRLSVSDGNTGAASVSARTIFALPPDEDSLAYRLTGQTVTQDANGTLGEEILLGDWEKWREVNDAEILVEPAEYHFTLNAFYKDGTTNFKMYSGTVSNVVVKEGATTELQFDLTQSDELVKEGEGIADVTFHFPGDAGVTRVVCSLRSVDTFEEISKYCKEFSIFANGSSFADTPCVSYFQSNIPSGNYILKFILYAAEEEIPPGYMEVIQIKNCSVSRAERTLSLVRNNHTLTLDRNAPNGKTVVFMENVALTFSEQETVTLPTSDDIYCDGYSFLGWYEDTSGTGGAIHSWAAGERTSDVTLYALWQENSYTVELRSNNGDDKRKTVAFVLGEKKALPKNDFTLTGYTFLGWATDDASRVEDFSDGQSVAITDIDGAAEIGSTIPLYAVWKANTYTIRYDKNGDDASGSIEAQDCSYDIPRNLRSNGFTRTGYTFLGWGTKSGATAADIVYKNKQQVKNLSAADGANVTLYAVWQGGTIKYSVKHFQQNVSGSGYTMVSADTEVLGGEVSAPTAATANEYEGFVCVGTDNTTVDATINQVNIAGDGSTVVSIYYDRKKINFTFNANGGKWSDGTTAKKTVSGLYGSIVSAPVNPTLANSKFAGWDVAVPKTFVADKTYNATWEGNSYTVVYNANGGSGFISNQNFIYGKSQALNACIMKRTGYSFAGWAKSQTGGKVYNDRQSVLNLTSIDGGTVTLYAVWTACTYNIRFNANGGSGTMKDQGFTYDKIQRIGKNTFTRAAYTFIGWTTQKGGRLVEYQDGQEVKNLCSTSGATFTLYAVWKFDATLQVSGQSVIVSGKTGTATAKIVSSSGSEVSISHINGAKLTWSSSDTSARIVSESGSTATIRGESGLNGNTMKTAVLTATVSVDDESVFGTVEFYIIPTTLTQYVFRLICPDYATTTSYEIPMHIEHIADTNDTSHTNFTNLGNNTGGVFYGCKALQSVTIPNTVKTIGSYAFKDTPIRSISIPDSVTSISTATFLSCKKLSSVTLGKYVKSIGWHAFAYCYSLGSITIPASVNYISGYAFYTGAGYEDEWGIFRGRFLDKAYFEETSGWTHCVFASFFGETGLAKKTMADPSKAAFYLSDKAWAVQYFRRK